MKNHVTLIACDKDSSGTFTQTFSDINTVAEAEKAKEDFAKEVPFPRWYMDYEADQISDEVADALD